jgi:lipoprotein signal peptidase
VKKKTNLKIKVFFGMWLVGELIHCWLSANNVVVKNYGISFGIEGWFLIFLNVILVALLTWVWWKNDLGGINLIVVGGWINLFDRIIFGHVRDYWQLGSVYNNVADWIIQIGVIIFLSKVWIKKLK